MLRRNLNNKVLGGVCSGIAKYLNIDPIIVRSIFVILLLLYGITFWIYLLMWIFINPE